MKNIKKRLLSLVLAVVMVLSMSMSVFAADGRTAGNINVKIQISGETYCDETISIAEIETALATKGVEHFYTTAPFTNYAKDGVKDVTIADALIYAYNKYYQETAGKWTEAEYDSAYTTSHVAKKATLSYAWDTNYYHKGEVDEKIPGMYFLYFDGITTENEKYEPTSDGKIHYSSNSWLLTNNGAQTDYASSVAVKAGDQIVMNHTYQSFIY